MTMDNYVNCKYNKIILLQKEIKKFVRKLQLEK